MENAGKITNLYNINTSNLIPFQNSHACHFFEQPSGSSQGGGGGGATADMNHVCFSDPHFMCLNLGKRHYFGEAATTGHELCERRPAEVVDNIGYCLTKKGKVYDGGGGGSGGGGGGGMVVVVARCQVDGCHVELVNGKEYHKRHKVCEVHSKAPNVMLFGIQQRFCQQCSRFHAVSEFDGSKRSCRRRLACHNERRRKSSQEHSASFQKHYIGNTEMMMSSTSMHPHYMQLLPVGCAHSLLSSSKGNTTTSWMINSAAAADLPTRCSTALRELIVKNRAAVLAQQLMLGNDNDNDYLQTQGSFHAPHQNDPDHAI